MIKHIKKLLQLQNTIMACFRLTYPKIKDFDLLLDFPSKGNLEILGQEWVFIKHGKGIKFIRKNPLPEIIVNIHNYITNPNVFDEWRLIQFLESMNIYITKNEIDNCLESLLFTNFLTKISEKEYELNKENHDK
ncbi:DUF6896 domain-containing protein [Gilliamella sp. CG25]|uniref:DUF6896 domain-containing protein n=1 Tax=unclassified Gilliamella TaxID=2685620 RepID=UPI0039886638